MKLKCVLTRDDSQICESEIIVEQDVPNGLFQSMALTAFFAPLDRLFPEKRPPIEDRMRVTHG